MVSFFTKEHHKDTMKTLLLLILTLTVMSAASSQAKRIVIDPQLLRQARSNDYDTKSAAIISLTKIVQQGVADDATEEILVAAISFYDSQGVGVGSKDIVSIGMLQTQLIEVIGRQKSRDTSDFLKILFNLAKDPQLNAFAEYGAMKTMTGTPNEEFLHFLMSGIQEESKVGKKKMVASKILLGTGWAAIPSILSYFSQGRDPLATKSIAEVLKNIAGEKMADSIVASKIGTEASESALKGLQQLRDAIKNIESEKTLVDRVLK